MRDERAEFGQEPGAAIHLGFYVLTVKRDESHIVPLLPVLIELIVESAPFSIELTGLDEFTMECGADSRVLLEGSLPVEERRAHPVECRVVEAINGEEVGSGAEFSTRRGQALFSLRPPVPYDIRPGF
jgi:hypothetical protein